MSELQDGGRGVALNAPSFASGQKQNRVHERELTGCTMVNSGG